MMLNGATLGQTDAIARFPNMRKIPNRMQKCNLNTPMKQIIQAIDIHQLLSRKANSNSQGNQNNIV
jgi:hypothetical protein